MKILIGYAIILGFLISFSNCYNFSVSVDPYHEVIYKFVKAVITDWNQKHENGINDISIINLNNDTSLFNIVRQAIPKENPVLLPECTNLNNTGFLDTKESSIFIIVSKVASDLVKINSIIKGIFTYGVI